MVFIYSNTFADNIVGTNGNDITYGWARSNYQCDVEQNASILGCQEKSATNITRPLTNFNLFANSSSNNFSSSKVIWEVSNILTRKQDLPWFDDAEGKHVYRGKAGKGELEFWVASEAQAQRPEAVAGEVARTIIQNFDIRAVCMHLIYAAHVTALSQPWVEEFVLDDRQIASCLGLDKRKDIKIQERLKLIERLALQPAQICTCLRWPAQGRVGAFYIEKSKIWEIAISHYGQSDSSNKIKDTGLTIRGRAGLWAKYFLNRQGQAEGKAFYQYGVLSKKLLQTITKIWQHNEGAARMLAWLVFKTRLGSSQPLIASTLMEVAYGANKVAAAQSNPESRTKLASTWDNDLLILQESGWRIEFDPLTYPPEIQPDWKFAEAARKQNKRPRGFWQQLRNGRVVVYPPPEIAAGLGELERNKLSLNQARSKPTPTEPEQQPQSLTKEEIKTVREAKGWSQSRLALEMGKSKMWVSLIERGLRQLKTVDQEKLRVVLNLDE